MVKACWSHCTGANSRSDPVPRLTGSLRSPFSGAVEITLGVRPDGGARIVALTGGVPLPAGNELLCAAVQPGSGKCRPDFPAVAHVGLIGGVEKTSSIGAMRIAVGPAFFGGGGPSGLGGHVQLDVAGGSSHLAFVLAASGSVVSRFNGDILRLASLGFGLRVR